MANYLNTNIFLALPSPLVPMAMIGIQLEFLSSRLLLGITLELNLKRCKATHTHTLVNCTAGFFTASKCQISM